MSRSNIFVTRLLALVLLATATGCPLVRRTAADQGYPGPEALQPGLAASFAYEPAAVRVELLDTRSLGGGLSTTELRFHFSEGIDGRELPMRAAWIRRKAADGTGKSPCVILLPILGGGYELLLGASAALADEGFHVLLPYREIEILDSERTPEQFNAMVIADTVRLRRAIDWLAAQPEVDSSRLGVMGISMGAIRAVILASVEPRLRACVFVMAGGPLADVLAESKEKAVVRFRERVMAREGWTRDEFRRRYDQALLADPLRLAPQVDARRCLQFITVLDEVVPLRRQEALNLGLGKPESWRVMSGHYSLAVYFDWCMDRSADFFRKKFSANDR